jgi:soluble lytic murein transglycosylase-like protein
MLAAGLIPTIITAVLVLAGVGAVYTLIRDAKKDHMELVSALSKNTQDVVLLKVIDERVKAPMETKVLMSRTILTLSSLKRLPVDVVCGIIEVESRWDPSLTSNAGAVGIMQVMPATGKAYLRAERIDPTKHALLDPVNNLICGIGALSDFHDQAVDLGLDKSNEFGVTLAMYNGGPRMTKPNGYSQAVLEAAKKYKAMGL